MSLPGRSVTVTCSAHGAQVRHVGEVVLVTDAEADADLVAQHRHADVVARVLPGRSAVQLRRSPVGVTLRHAGHLRRRGDWRTAAGASHVRRLADGRRVVVLACSAPECSGSPAVLTEAAAAALARRGTPADLDSLRPPRRQGQRAT